MKLKEILKFMLILTCVITIGQILLASVMAIIRGGDIFVDARHLYRYPLMAFSSILPTLIFVNSGPTTKKGWKIRVILHFFLTTAIVLGNSIYHDYYWWRVGVDVGILIPKMLLFIGIYLGVWWVSNRQQQSLSDELNERINEFYDDEHVGGEIEVS